MEKQFILKIKAIQKELSEKCLLKAAAFDKYCDEAKLFKEANDSIWNKYVHKNCLKYGFVIWKNKFDHNFYVKDAQECIVEAENHEERLRPWTTKELYKSKKR